MTPPRNRLLTLAAVVALAIGATGCGFLHSAANLAGNAKTLGDLSDRITAAGKLTYQATYQLAEGGTVTVAQQPPNAAQVGATGRFVVNPDAFYLCAPQDGVLTCQKTPTNNGTVSTDDAALAASVAGPGFMSAQVALGILTVALLVPQAKVDKSTETIAGQRATCAKVSGLEKAQQDTGTKLADFTMCVTDAGILARFTGTDTDGKRAGVELTRYTTKVDTSLFTIPADAKITDLGALPSVAASLGDLASPDTSDYGTAPDAGGSAEPSPSS